MSPPIWLQCQNFPQKTCNSLPLTDSAQTTAMKKQHPQPIICTESANNSSITCQNVFAWPNKRDILRLRRPKLCQWSSEKLELQTKTYGQKKGLPLPSGTRPTLVQRRILLRKESTTIVMWSAMMFGLTCKEPSNPLNQESPISSHGIAVRNRNRSMGGVRRDQLELKIQIQGMD